MNKGLIYVLPLKSVFQYWMNGFVPVVRMNISMDADRYVVVFRKHTDQEMTRMSFPPDVEAADVRGQRTVEAGPRLVRVHREHVTSPLLHGDVYGERPVTIPDATHTTEVASVDSTSEDALAEVERIHVLTVRQQQMCLEIPANGNLFAIVMISHVYLSFAHVINFVLLEINNFSIDIVNTLVFVLEFHCLQQVPGIKPSF